MPSIKLSKPLGWAHFMSKGHKMPSNASFKSERERHLKESESREYYMKGIGVENWGASSRYMPLFTAQLPHRYHQDASTTASVIYQAIHDHIIDGFEYAHGVWRMQAHFKGILVNGPIAVGGPGCLKGPDFYRLMLSYPGYGSMSRYSRESVVFGSKNYRRWYDAVSKALAECHDNYVKGVTVPGLLWFPAFSAFPAPRAVMMPCVCLPFIQCTSIYSHSMFNEGTIKSKILYHLGRIAQKSEDSMIDSWAESVAKVISIGYLSWASTQPVMVNGNGQVPTYAPPVVPAGPVIGGDVSGSPALAL